MPKKLHWGIERKNYKAEPRNKRKGSLSRLSLSTQHPGIWETVLKIHRATPLHTGAFQDLAFYLLVKNYA